MRLYCLSSLTSVSPESYKITPYEAGADELRLSTPNIHRTLKTLKANVKNSLPYKLTEICIGYEFDDRPGQQLEEQPPRKLYVMKVYRDNFKPSGSLNFKLVVTFSLGFVKNLSGNEHWGQEIRYLKVFFREVWLGK